MIYTYLILYENLLYSVSFLNINTPDSFWNRNWNPHFTVSIWPHWEGWKPHSTVR